MGVGALRVFNDDRIVAGADWPMHPHRDIESLTYVVDGQFLHADSLGNNVFLRAGAAQVMRFSSSGGDLHSERNGSAPEPMRFIQFWILPSEPGLETSVQQRQYSVEDRTDQWLQIMSPAGEDGLDLAQDARALVTRLADGAALKHSFDRSRAGYLYLIDGEAVDQVQTAMAGGDAATLQGPEDLVVSGRGVAEMILVDVPLEFRAVGVWAS